MQGSKLWLCAAAVAALSVTSSVALATDEDVQAWQASNLTRSFNSTLFATLETQTRVTEDVSHLGQLIIRPSISYKLNEQLTATAGYAYVMTDVTGRRVTHEHRAWQQLAFPIFKVENSITVTGRFRFEERQFEGRDDTGYRIRQQVRAMMPLSNGIQGVLWSEVFFHLNDTDWGARSGFDRWRNFAGVSIPLMNGVTFEPGYLNQYVNRVGEDRVDHVLSTTVNVKF